ncbi:MAG: serine/threonine protein kinase [Candidatus Accumulibacter sp.]|jgi:tRNA A-37 threonylcarbamoyl transferase component Bud32|nr:serine/threonine protein kinase [Accumulibacter sp.]
MSSTFSLAELANSGRNPALPFELVLPDGATLRVERLLRVLPARRYVGVGVWKKNGVERKVLAKLIVGAKAERDLAREKRGSALLAEQGMDTPALLEDFFSPGEGGGVLFEYLERAQSVGERWKECEGASDADEARSRIVRDALCAVAALHLKGLRQEDLHPDNLLYQGGRLHIIDAGGIRAETPGLPLDPEKALENLGVFFAQLPSKVEASLPKWLDVYTEINPSCRARLDPRALRAAVDRAKRHRMRDFLKKTVRDCSLFRVEKSGPFGAFGFCAVRREDADALARILADPDAFIARGHIYKTGGTATVARVEDGGRAFVVKRYNIKNFRHWVGRFWRPSRASTSWREGNRLVALGIPTAKPLAMIERRWLGLRGTAFLITEYLEGRDIMACFRDEPAAGAPALGVGVCALRELFAALRRERIAHGDFKGSNLIWQGGETRGSWALIDLDAMRVYTSASRFVRAFSRDRDRLLRNWPEDSPLYRALNESIPPDANEEN